MADSPAQTTLKRAYDHIKKGDKSAAIRLIKPVLQKDRDNPAAWFLLANATGNPNQAKKALNEVLRLRPGDSRAQKMLTQIEMGNASPTPPPPNDADPFAILDSASDPFARTAPRSHVRDNIDAAFEEDDPFTGVLAQPVRNAATSSRSKPGASTDTDRIIILLIALVIFGGILLIGAAIVVNLGDSSSLDEIASAFGIESETPLQGTCAVSTEEVGYFSENTVINCGSLELDQRWNGDLDAYQTHDWYLEAEAGRAVSIRVSSEDQDTVLSVYGPDNRLIADNDDISPGNNTDSRLDITLLESGTYRISVRMFFDSGGSYVIDLQDDGLTNLSQITTCANVIAHRDSIDTFITCGEVRAGSAVTAMLPGNTVHEWRLIEEPGRRVTIEMNGTSSGMDPLINIYSNRTAPYIASNDDIEMGENLDARVTFTMPDSGVVTIGATQFGFNGGTYRLSVR